MIQRLCAEPGRFAFFQAVRLLEAERRGAEDSAEVVRFHTRPSLGFPAGEVRAVEPRGPRAGWAVSVDLLGLVGVLGTLPLHYTELVLERLQLKDTTLLDFLDLFQHRSLAFFYRAWRKYRFAFEVEAGGRACDDPFSGAVLSLTGFGLPGTRERLALSAGSLAFLAGHLGHRPRSAAGLEGLLGEYFGTPCRVEPFVGRWLEVPESERSRLSSRSPAALGSFFVGGRTWDVSSKVRVHVGPVDPAHFRMFMPGQPGHRRLEELVWCYLGPGRDCEVVVEPGAGSIGGLRLGEAAAELGRNTWLAPRSGRVDPAVFQLARPVDT